MSKELDNIIKEELMRDIQIEADDSGTGKKIKSPGKVGGLVNLGKTCFINQQDVEKAKEFANMQMLQKFGKEMYGNSAAQKNIHANKASTGNDDGTGTGFGSVTSGGLIDCTVTQFRKLPKKFFESGNFNNFKAAWDEFEKMVKNKAKDDKWKSSHFDSWKKISELRNEIRERDPEASNYFNKIKELLSQKPWVGENEFKKSWDKVQNNWEEYSGKKTSIQSSQGNVQNTGENAKTDWIPEMTWRIDVVTHFDDSWFQRKFKSGLLNKAIMAIKTDAMSKAADGSMKDHVYTANEMLPQDRRKLDSIQWKMTNKVAKSYITYLLGNIRKKEYKIIDGKPVPVENELKFDEGVGSSFAKKALSNRGILNRMVQKVFSGSQSNNVISVVFQSADPNDGWTLVDADDADDVQDTQEQNMSQVKDNVKDELPIKNQKNDDINPISDNKPNIVMQNNDEIKQDSEQKEEIKQSDNPNDQDSRVSDISKYKMRPHKTQSEYIKPGTPSEDAILPHGTDFNTQSQVDVYNQKFEKGEEQGKADINKDFDEIDKKIQGAASRVGSNKQKENDKKNNKAYIGNAGWMNGYADGADVELKYNETTLKLCEGNAVFESDRYVLVKELCEGKNNVAKLIDNCLNGYKYR